MTDDMLGPSPMHIMYMTDFAYDGPIFLVPLSPSYPSSPVEFYWKRISEDSVYRNRQFHLDIVSLNTYECLQIKKKVK